MVHYIHSQSTDALLQISSSRALIVAVVHQNIDLCFFLIAEPDSPPKNDWISVWNCLAAFSKKFLNFQYRIIPDSRATGYSADFCHVHGRGGRGVPYINSYGLHDCHDCSAPWLYHQRKAKNAQSGPWKLNMMVFNRDIDLRPFLTNDTDSLPQNW